MSDTHDPKNPDANAVSVDTLIAAAPAAADEADATGLVGIVEALIFASPEPITPKQLFKVLDSEPKEEVLAAVEELKRRYARSGGLQLVEVAAGYQIVTRPELHEWVRRLFHERTSQKLSVAALETLAVIAYKQPVTAIEIAEIRGVNTAGVIGTLLERSLVKISGRKQVVGRPFLYSTTREFLDRFGLRDLTDLPRVEDMADALGFEPPAGLAQQADLAEEQATPEDQQVLFGEGEEGAEGRRSERGRGRRAGAPYRAVDPGQAMANADGLPERPNFLRGQLPRLTGLQPSIRDRPYPDARQLFHGMTHRFAHPPHLPVPSFT